MTQVLFKLAKEMSNVLNKSFVEYGKKYFGFFHKI